VQPWHQDLRVPKFSAIAEHNRVFEQQGKVLLLKAGAPIGQSHLDKMRQQKQAGADAKLYLCVRTRHGSYKGYFAAIDSIINGRVPKSLENLIPLYYDEVGYTGYLWFLLSSPLIETSLGQLKLVSNRKPLLEVLPKCRTSAMVVTDVPLLEEEPHSHLSPRAPSITKKA
jgi:hypothetical protein